MKWEPGTYEAFREARHRPLLDLVAPVPRTARTVVDAGCGTGRTTHDLAARFRNATVTGIDASSRMIGLARPEGRVAFAHADLDQWSPPAQVDVVVSNAVLHWLPDPAASLRRMASWLAPGGFLALQVPANFDAPSHRIAAQVAAAHGCPPSPAQDVPLEAPLGWLPDLAWNAWETTYLHALPGEDAVLRWLSGTTLRPYLGRGKEADQAFLADLGARLREAYPPAAPPGPVRFPFTRRFWVGAAT